ncbi:uncharacterized protein KY384_000705 [Bacidia gigantensis]|uniref:uncharacterized protein n=1 Tax=Bacidia gigantensis TaxID=2732470 RepID=UPI001D045BA8|nr:uncharacterized protein KY384_000705 [Bacidia gigantensis]KAG8525943.1 hypothetical protein KY384_000705 [Bacidia gigantensis]
MVLAPLNVNSDFSALELNLRKIESIPLSNSPTRIHRLLRIQSRIPFWVGASATVYTLGFYAFSVYLSHTKPLDPSTDPQSDTSEKDVSGCYNEIANKFDSEVGGVETTTLLWLLRRRLVSQVDGHVLEVSAGTGRNHKYYNVKACKSITFVDQSAPMLEIAIQKWKDLWPQPPPDTAIAFKRQATLDIKEKPKNGYDYIIQSMGVCSTPVAAETIAHLGTLLNQKTGRILLLEHGRGRYNWINNFLDRSAARHAERFGCYHNKDIREIIEESGLVIERIDRPYWWNMGTVWVVEARPKGWNKFKQWTMN